MTFPDLFRWLCVGASLVLVVCSIAFAFRPEYPAMLRFGPLAVVCAYFAALAIHFLVQGPASVLLLPVGCFGLYLAVRLLTRRSVLAYIYTACSFVFWPPSLFFFGRYVFLRYLQHLA